jgi:hypothetical protein
MEAYGFDLSPLAVPYFEFLRLAEEERAERHALGCLRPWGTIAGMGIVQTLETAHDYGLRGEEWATLKLDAQAVVRALNRVERHDELEVGVASLEQLQREARTRPEMLLQDVK